MSEGKRLSAKQLDAALDGMYAMETHSAAAAAARVRAHIAALEAEIARLKPSGQVAEDEEKALAGLGWGKIPDGAYVTGDESRAAIRRLAAKAHGYEAFAAACREALGPHRSTGTPADVALLHKDLEAARAFSVQFGKERDEAMREVDRLRAIIAYIQECDGGPHLLTEAGALAADRQDEVREERDEAERDRASLLGEKAALDILRMEAERERDVAVADNAALVAHLRVMVTQLGQSGHVDAQTGPGPYVAALAACKEPHPGAALLEQHRKEIECWRENVSEVTTERDTERRLRKEAEEEHRKALVRARNEGLELVRAEAARQVGEYEALDSEVARDRAGMMRALAADISDLKEPEE